MAQETISGELPSGYVAVKEVDIKRYKIDIKAYKKLLQDHAYLQDMYESLQGQHKDLLYEFELYKKSSSKDQTEYLNMKVQLEKLKKTAEENRETIDNLKRSLRYCREQVSKYKRRNDRKAHKRDVRINGENSSLDLSPKEQ